MIVSTDAGPGWRLELLGVGLGLLAAVCFASQAVVAKLAYRAGVNPPTMAAMRCVLGSAALWLIVLLRGRSQHLSARNLIRLMAIGVTIFATESIVLFEALRYAEASTVVLIVYSYPAMVYAMTLALGRDRLQGRRVLAISVSFIGVALVIQSSWGETRLIGVALALLAAFLTAAFAVAAEPIVAHADRLSAGAVVLTGASASLLAVGAASGDFDFDVSPVGWGWMAVQGLVLITVGLTTYLAAISFIGPSRTAIVDAFGPVAGVILAALTLAERPTLLQLVGGFLVIAAVLFLVAARRRGVGGPVTAASRGEPR